MTTVDTTRRN